MRLSLLAGGGQPLSCIALIFIRQVIGGIKRHARMQMGNVLFNAAFAGIAVQRFIAFKAVALTDIVRQFLYQHRRITLTIILNRAADIADV